MSMSHNCRFCEHPLEKTLIDLGTSPLSNSYLKPEDLNKKEIFYPLHVRICDQCFLAQLPQFESPEYIFNDYAYFSSYSDSWLKHMSDYTNMMIERFRIDKKWQIVELASNDGYLLQYFHQKNIPVLGIEPASNVAEVARGKGIPTESFFFGKKSATDLLEKGVRADLLIANNVLAHVPDLNDFVAGMAIILAPKGIITIEFPHLLHLINEKQFDTIYHEHFSYFSFLTVKQVFEKHQLKIFDVDELAAHGGSLRIYVKHMSDDSKEISPRVDALLEKERQFGLDSLDTYQHFSKSIEDLKHNLLEFILSARKSGKRIAGYGAPAKGNTLLNYCGIFTDMLSFTVDRNPHKQQHYLPGTRIPIYAPDKIREEKPDYVLVLPWNLKNEVMEQMAYIKDWGGKFIIPIPELQVI